MQVENTISLNNFQERLADALVRRNLSQSELAKKMGIRQSTVASWLGGSTPRDRILTELSIALQTSRRWFTSGEPPMEMSDEEKALSEDRLRGGTPMANVIKEDAAPYRVNTDPANLLRDEIMAALNAAHLSADELRRKTLHQRIDEYLDELKKKGT